MPVLRFHLLDLYYSQVAGAFLVTVTTNAACHLYLRYSDNFPYIHRKSVLRRGLVMGWDARYCFTAYHHIEQNEPGDEWTHTFTWPGWVNCDRRYFYFWGTMGGLDMVSDTPIFWLHYLLEVGPPLPHSTFYCSAMPADLAVDGYVGVDTLRHTWPQIRAHPGDTASDDGTGIMVKLRVSGTAPPNNYYQLYRCITCFNLTPGIGYSVQSGTLYLLAGAKYDTGNIKPAINAFSAAPANHGNLAAGDYDSLGETPFSTQIGYDDWIYEEEHAFPLNADCLAYINAVLATTGLLAIGWREAKYDALNIEPFPDRISRYAILSFFTSEQSDAARPRLVLN